MKEAKIEIFDWPSRSPDLNPIENLWGLLVRNVYQGGKSYSSQEELWESIKNCWNNIEKRITDSLVSSMKERMVQVIKMNGGNLNY